MQVTENQYDRAQNLTLIHQVQSADEERAMLAMEQILQDNIGLIRSIVLRFRERGVEMEDLMQIGYIGMMKAVRSFELDRGTAFSTYAVPMIFGEIRRYLRDEGPIKIGRYYKKLGMDLMRERSRIVSEDGREPGIEELSSLCGVSPQEAAMALEAASPILSLSEYAYGDEQSVELGAVIPDRTDIEEMESLRDRIALGEAITKMPMIWQQIVLLRYYRNQTQQQTANQLGLTQVKISREEKKIIEFLKEELLK